ELERFLRGEPVEAKAVGTVRQIRSTVRRHRSRFGIALAAAALLAVAAVTAITLSRQRDEAVGLLREAARLSVDAALRSRKYGREYLQAVLDYRWIAQADRAGEGIPREEVEQRYPRLQELRDGILADSAKLAA